MSLPTRIQACLLVIAMLGPGSVCAVDIAYQTPAPQQLPQRRLMADPAQPAGAPSSLQIEAAAIQDGRADAVRLAARALELSEAAYGASDARTISPRINLAYTRLWDQQIAAAQREFRSAVAALEPLQGERDPRLVEAWYGLAATQFAALQYEAASESLSAALHFDRALRGLFAAEQLDVLHALTLADTRRGKPRAAESWQKRRLEVAARSLPADSPEQVRTYVSVGRWYRDQGRSKEAVALHQRAVAAREASDGRDSLELVGPLLDLALSMGTQPRSGFRGVNQAGTAQDRALTRALRIALAAEQRPATERVRLLHLIGDANWMVGRRGGALEAYGQAARLGAGTAVAIPAYERPGFLTFYPPPTAQLENAAGEVAVAEFVVDRLGRARNIRIVQAAEAVDPAEIDNRLVRALQRARFRPRLEGGQPVATPEVRYRLLAESPQG